MKGALIAGAFMLTASQAFAQYSSGMIGDQSFMINTFQNDKGSYSTGMIGNHSFGITTFDPLGMSFDLLVDPLLDEPLPYTPPAPRPYVPPLLPPNNNYSSTSPIPDPSTYPNSQPELDEGSYPNTGLVPANSLPQVSSDLENAVIIMSKEFPAAWLDRMHTCENMSYGIKHLSECTADYARITVYLYMYKNVLVTSKMNACQHVKYVSKHLTDCLDAILEHKRNILPMYSPG